MDKEKVLKGEWSLAELYAGYEDPSFTADVAEMDRLIARMDEQSMDLTGEPKKLLPRLLKTQEQLTELIGKLMLYVSLRQSACTTDAKASSLMDQLSAKLSRTAAPLTRIRQYVAGLNNLEELIAADPLLTDYAFLLRNTKEDSKYLLDPKCEEIISLYENTGSDAWSNLQSYLTSTVPVEYRGETITLSDVRNLAYDPDPQVRKDAFHAEMACYERIKDAVAFSLNSIKLEVLNNCRLRGYESPLAETLHTSRMTAATLDALLTAMREFLPRLQPFYRHKAKLLGHEGGLPWYDLFAPLSAEGEKYTKETARDYLLQRFSSFDKELTEMVRTAFDEGWIDFYPREGKVGGAFCAEAFPIRASRILTNFAGSFDDVVTLAHELGHAFHNLNLYDNRPLNRDYSMPVAETASTFNEVLVMNDAIRSAADPVKRRALIHEQLSGDLQIICDIYSRYRFETMVFENRDESFMFPPELCDMMVAAQKEGYGDGLDWAEPNSYMWLCKSHYYSGLSFYNWPYAFGGMLARGLYACYEREGTAFVPKYKSFLKATAVMTAEDAGKVAGIDLTDVNFWRSGLEGLAKEVEEFGELCKLG